MWELKFIIFYFLHFEKMYLDLLLRMQISLSNVSYCVKIVNLRAFLHMCSSHSLSLVQICDKGEETFLKE